MSSKAIVGGTIGVVVGLLLGVVVAMFVLPPQVETETLTTTATVVSSFTSLSTVKEVSSTTVERSVTQTETVATTDVRQITVTETAGAPMSETEYMEARSVVLGHIKHMNANLSEALGWSYIDPILFCECTLEARTCLNAAFSEVGFMVPPRGYENSHHWLVQSLKEFDEGALEYYCWGDVFFEHDRFHEMAESNINEGRECLLKSDDNLP